MPPSKPTTVELEADAGGAGVEDDGDRVAEIGGDMGGRGRADMAGAVGARRGERHAGRPEHGLRDRVGRDADRDRVEAGGGEVADAAVRPPRQDQRQRAGPEGVGEAARRPAA